MGYSAIAETVYGKVILNRNDRNQSQSLLMSGYGVNHEDIAFLCDVARMCNPGAVCVDIGANYGLYTLALAEAVKSTGGKVLAFEGQRVLSYMICGSIALNCVENAKCFHAVVGKGPGTIPIPQYDYTQVGSFGSVEFRTMSEDVHTERLPDNPFEFVDIVALNDLNLDRLDLIKIDAEGMEIEILENDIDTIKRFRPIAWIEWLKSDKNKLVDYFDSMGYGVYEHGWDILCVPNEAFNSLHNLNWPKLNRIQI